MARAYLLLFAFFISFIAQDVSAGQAEVLGGCYWDNTRNRIVIRLCMRNLTNSTADMKLVGMRFGFQYNEVAVNYAGFKSLMNNGVGTIGLDDLSYLTEIGMDTPVDPALVGVESPSSRTANFLLNGVSASKIMQRRFINRSTLNCANTVRLPPGTIVPLLEIYFTLDNNNPAFYNLTSTDAGFNTPGFIAQFLTGTSAHSANLMDAKKEIAVIVIRNGNEGNPYQPFDINPRSCDGGNNTILNPVTVDGDDINFVSPSAVGMGPLNGAFDKVQLRNRYQDKVELSWNYLNNEMVKYFQIERAIANSAYEVVKQVTPRQISGNADYELNDVAFNSSVSNVYRVKAVLNNGDFDFSQSLLIHKQSRGVSLYPNPAKNSIQTVLPEGFTNAQYRVFSSTGNLLKNVQKPGNLNKLNIDDLMPGLYFLEVINMPTGERITAPFQKN